MRRIILPAVLATLTCTATAAFPASVGAQAAGPQHAMAAPDVVPGPIPAAELDAIRAATGKYRDVSAALADGYVKDPSNMCVTAAMEGAPRQLGAMGVHYFRPDLLGLAGTTPRVHGTGVHTDFLKPAILLYEPQADGSQQLVSIENLVWGKTWSASNHQAPNFHGYDYYAMNDNPNTEVDEAHGFEPHYELHFWLYRDNPNGMFSPFNPAVTCKHHVQ